MTFAMEVTESSASARTFTLVADDHWLAQPGLAALNLRFTTGDTGSAVTGQLNGGVTEKPYRGLNWLRFEVSVAASASDGMSGRLGGTIRYNQLSPGAFSTACDASGYAWSLIAAASSGIIIS